MPNDEKPKRFNESLPHSHDAEKAVLSSFLQDPNLIEEHSTVDETWMLFPAHAEILLMMREMVSTRKPVDLITLTQELGDAGILDAVGGAASIAEIYSFAATSANVRYYLTILREKKTRRDVITKLTGLIAEARDESVGTGETLVDHVESCAMQFRVSEAAGELEHIKVSLMAAMDGLEAVYKSRGGCLGLSTGLVDLDRMTGGLKGGQLIPLGGRPGKGKTALAMQISEHVALVEKKPVAVFSMEMGKQELVTRMLCSKAGVNLQRIRDGFLGKSDVPNLMRVSGEISKANIYLDHTPRLSHFEFRSRCRRAVLKYGVKLIVVDYLQLMTSPTKTAQASRQIEIAEISMSLKQTALELNVPIIAAVQLSRDADTAAGPKLIHIKESGQIEQDADLALLLHRPHQHDENKDAVEDVQMIIAKHRNGPVGTINLGFEPALVRFHNRTEKAYSNNPAERQGGNRA